MGGDRNTVHLLTRDANGVDIKIESWPVMTKERGRRRHWWRGSPKPCGEPIVSATVKVDIRQLPHGEGLALPAYQSADAAGLDLLAAVPEDSPLVLLPGRYALVPTG